MRFFRERHSHPEVSQDVPFYVLETEDWANVIAVNKPSVRHADAQLMWIQQYRVGSQSTTWEIPGGRCDKEDPSTLHSARRELAEEAGLHAQRWIHLGSLSPNPAVYRNRVHTYLALGCEHDPKLLNPDWCEVLESKWFPFSERHRLLQEGGGHALISAAFMLLQARIDHGQDC